MTWYRIDNRLVHGQVIEAWLPYIGANTIIVANDAITCDALHQDIILLAVPSRVRVFFLPIKDLQKKVEQLEAQGENTLVLFADCFDAQRALNMGVKMNICNIGNIHYSEEKSQVCSHVALSLEERACLKYMESKQVELDFRSIPAAKHQLKNW